MFIDKNEFDSKCKEVISDINNQKITSPAWGWMFMGAISGFVFSCLKNKKKEVKPILASYRKVSGEVRNG